jgi:zinc transporter 5/7
VPIAERPRNLSSEYRDDDDSDDDDHDGDDGVSALAARSAYNHRHHNHNHSAAFAPPSIVIPEDAPPPRESAHHHLSGHGHTHAHGDALGHARDHGHLPGIDAALASSPLTPARDHLHPHRPRPKPSPVSPPAGWKTEIMSNGRTVITSPTTGNFARAYTDPYMHRPHAHGHAHHDHGDARRSWLTRRLMELTSGSSIMHAIMVEKDSRRIAYFMTWVSRNLWKCALLTLSAPGSTFPS